MTLMPAVVNGYSPYGYRTHRGVVYLRSTASGETRSRVAITWVTVIVPTIRH
ncbi:hypothetical protein D9M73_292790 [compost metagenome]